MPAKKRKILTTTPSKSENMTQTMFKKVLARTMEQIELKQNIPDDELVKASLEHSELIDSFDSEFDAALTERLRSDANFLSILNSQQSSAGADKGRKEDEDAELEAKTNVDNLIYNKDRFAFSRKRFK